ncbi:MAG: HlyD family efflux transporter periplasmic adaptor subunit [Gemmatimonadota bacterium]|nr:HlyD family efflux transporter periplasmic adaptor subunit [Gemmatimonadota bacterium]
MNNGGLMNRVVKRALLIAAGLIVVGIVVNGYLAGRGERAKEAAREAPINAPSRMRATQGPLGGEAAVVLDSIATTRAGIATTVLRAATSGGGVELTGELLADPTRITTLQASVPGRLTAVGVHWPALGEHVAAGTVIAQVSDARPLATPRGGTVTRVTAQPGQLVQAGQELLQLTDFTELLARIAWRPEAPRTPPPTITITPLSNSGATVPAAATAHLVGPAAQVDSLTRLPIYLYRMSATWPGARPGAPVQTVLSEPRATAGAGIGGVFVPTSAVVQWEGLAWAYVQVGGGHGATQFVRRRVDTSDPVPGGWLVISPGALSVSVGDSVAVKGTQDLLSEEFRSRAGVGDAQDKQ